MQTPNSCSLHRSTYAAGGVGHTDAYFPKPFTSLLMLLMLFIAGPGRHNKSNDNFKLQGSEASLLALETQTTFVILLHSEIQLHKGDWWCLNYEELPMSEPVYPLAAASKTMSGHGLLPK